MGKELGRADKYSGLVAHRLDWTRPNEVVSVVVHNNGLVKQKTRKGNIYECELTSYWFNCILGEGKAAEAWWSQYHPWKTVEK